VRGLYWAPATLTAQKGSNSPAGPARALASKSVFGPRQRFARARVTRARARTRAHAHTRGRAHARARARAGAGAGVRGNALKTGQGIALKTGQGTR